MVYSIDFFWDQCHWVDYLGFAFLFKKNKKYDQFFKDNYELKPEWRTSEHEDGLGNLNNNDDFIIVDSSTEFDYDFAINSGLRNRYIQMEQLKREQANDYEVKYNITVEKAIDFSNFDTQLNHKRDYSLLIGFTVALIAITIILCCLCRCVKAADLW